MVISMYQWKNFVNNMSDLLDNYAPFKKISKYKLKTYD